MEKLSLYNLLSVLLPGALLTLLIEVLVGDLGLKIENTDVNQYFRLTLFLSSSIFLGSFINIITRVLFKLYKKIGLFTSINKIYKNTKGLDQLRPFYQEMIDSNPEIKDASKHKQIEYIWPEIYYELEAKNQIQTPKAFQSFYFFFRNFFTLGLIVFLPLLGCLIFLGFPAKYIFLNSINLLALTLSLFSGKWYRKQMVERMFWTYYSLYKNK